ncbi:MAG: hypothetical protein WCC50_00955, partial [Pseudolabrys sp.]
MEQRAHKTQALEALTHLRPLLRARRNHKKYLQNGFFSGLLGGTDLTVGAAIFPGFGPAKQVLARADYHPRQKTWRSACSS